jgi:hypothetical protein
MIEVESGSEFGGSHLFKTYNNHYRRLWEDSRTIIAFSSGQNSQLKKGGKVQISK